MAFWDSD